MAYDVCAGRLSQAPVEGTVAKEKLDEARGKIERQLTSDNALRGELQTEIDENQRLRDQINAGFSTPQHATPARSPASEPAKAGAIAVDPLEQWGQKVGNSQQ